jgi:hypothetical protein
VVLIIGAVRFCNCYREHGKARRQLLRPAPTHLPCQAEYLTVARAVYLGRVLASIPGRRVMLCDRARVIAGSDDQRRCPDASSLRPCRATRTFGLGRRFYGMSHTAVAAKKTVEVGKILIWSLTQFGCSPRWNGRLLINPPLAASRAVGVTRATTPFAGLPRRYIRFLVEPVLFLPRAAHSPQIGLLGQRRPRRGQRPSSTFNRPVIPSGYDSSGW